MLFHYVPQHFIQPMMLDLPRVQLSRGDPNITDVDVDRSTGVFLGFGFEIYQALRRSINLGFEAKHIWTEADVDYIGADPLVSDPSGQFRLDAWIVRLNFTYPC